MCGRARCTLRAQDVPRACGVNNNGSTRTVQMDRYRPSFNVSPGFYMPVVLREEGTEGNTVIHCMKWGLIPSFTKKTEKPDHYRMFNARSESISEKASFRRLIPNNRCIMVVEGFYEWKKDGSKKQPYYIHFKDERPLVFAALYDSWKNGEGETIYTFTILTTSCSSALEWLHDRMPVILGGQSSIDAWLSGSTPAIFKTVLKPYEDPDLVWYPVTPAMGKPSFDGPECIKEIQLKADENHLISNFFSTKRINNEKETKPQIKSSPQESASTDQSESLKEEEKNTDQCSTDSEQNKNPKSDDSPLHLWEARKCGMKREYEVLASDKKATTDKNEKLEKSPVKKKRNAKNAGTIVSLRADEKQLLDVSS